MRFLDVCLNPAARGSRTHPVPYVLIVQGDFVDIHVSKLVIPLRRMQQSPMRIKDVMPVVTVLEEPFVVMTPEMAAVSVTEIGPVVASLAESHSLIRRAIDVLTGDF